VEWSGVCTEEEGKSEEVKKSERVVVKKLKIKNYIYISGL